ncbi:MAG: hypothetical protein AAF721_27455 [Myxococcota bacterium]
MKRNKNQTQRASLFAVAALTGLAAAAAPIQASASGPRVHILNEAPDDDRGIVKLARYRGSTTQAGGNAIVITTHYDELCNLPCGEKVDVSERPIFFLVRDQQPVSYGFRLPETDEVTLSVKPNRKGMFMTGFMLTAFLILPVGIPLMVVGRPKVSIASGPPSDNQVFKKLKKAKT